MRGSEPLDATGTLARAFAMAGAALLLVFLMGFLLKLGTERVHPLELRAPRSPDGAADVVGASAATGRARVTEMRIGADTWRPPGALSVSRRLVSLPPGTPLAYRVIKERIRSEVSGEVLERPASTAATLSALVSALLAIVLAASGAALAAASTERRGVIGGAALTGIGVLLGAVVREPTLVQLQDSTVRNNATLVWLLYPRDCTFFFLVTFLQMFPGRAPAARMNRGLSLALLATGLVSVASLTLAQIPGLLESWLSLSAQVQFVRGVRSLRVVMFGAAALFSLRLLAMQYSLYRRLALPESDRRRARLLGRVLAFACACPVAVALAQTMGILASGRRLIGTEWMTIAFTPLLLIPIALSYVLLAREPLSFRLLVHRARLFSFSDRTLGLLLFAPLFGLLFFIYRHRGTPLGELLLSRPLFLMSAGAAAVVGLLYRDRARRALEGVFFHDRAEARRVMGELAEKSRTARDPASLEQLLSGEIGRALHAESVALFVRDRVSHTFVCPSRSLPTLNVDSGLAGAAGTKGVLDLDPADRRSPLATLPEIERHWVEESHARLVLPLAGADGHVIGLLAIGENLSELPWDKEDKSLLVAAAASGALALENSLLRSSGGPGPGAGRPVATHEEEDLARSCHVCAQIFSSALGPLCPDDQVPLSVADVPHVLAGKYRFERRIGSGGMGVVYLARDLSLGRFVAVKTLPKVSPEAAMRLRREARATARVLHPNLAVIFAAETWHGTPMLMLEYLEGGTLAPRIARGPIPVGQVVEWGIALSGALEAAHAKGVLHRDIKPSNIGFTAGGEPKLLDFGLASLFEEPELLAAIETTTQEQDLLETTEVKQMTGSGRIVGTLPYLAPEAILGETPQVSFDLWSLALTLYEATTGRNPFFEMPAEKTLNRILSQTPPPARTLRADCPEDLSAFFMRALARKPAERFHSARELHRALRSLAPSIAA